VGNPLLIVTKRTWKKGTSTCLTRTKHLNESR
jgi:hypothetical protein